MFSPVGLWLTYAVLFESANDQPGQPLGSNTVDRTTRPSLASALGFSNETEAALNTFTDATALTQSLNDDGVVFTHRLWMDPQRSSLSHDQRTALNQICDSPVDWSNQGKAATIGPNEWALNHSHGLIDNAIDYRESGSGMPSAYGVNSIYLDTTVTKELVTSQGVGPLTLVTYAGGQDASQSYGRYNYYSDDSGVQGVAVPSNGSKLTVYFFTASSASALSTFESKSSAKSWKGIAGLFVPTDGRVMAGFTLKSVLYMPQLAWGSVGGSVASGVSQRAVAVTNAQSIQIDVTSAFTVDNPICCVDFVPQPTPDHPFTLSTTAPLMMLILDRSGLVVFMAAS